MSDQPDLSAWQSGTSVVLPCAPDQFQEFIAGLLGRPQTLEGRFFGSFAVSKENLIQLYHLVTQRVQQQNVVLPIQVISKVGYSDGTSVQLNSMDDFNSYVEVRNVCSTTVTLSFIYVIGFPGRSVPERQEIEISFKSETDGGAIDYRIHHTARTWGADLETLLTSFIGGTLKKQHPVRQFIAMRSGKIGISTGLILMAGFLTGMSLTFDHVTQYQLASLHNSLAASAPVSLKLDTALRMLASGVWQKFSVASLVYCLFAIVTSILAAAVVGTSLGARGPSAVLLTNAATARYAARDRSFSLAAWKFAATCFVSIVVGLATNYIYDAYCKNLMFSQSIDQGTKKIE
jgi:hypothetical protein